MGHVIDKLAIALAGEKIVKGIENLISFVDRVLWLYLNERYCFLYLIVFLYEQTEIFNL